MLPLLAALSLIPLTIGGGVVAVKASSQWALDRNRKTYRLGFPRDLDEERVMAWVRSISGTLRPSSFHVGGSPTVVFELWGTNDGITHRIKVPWQHADYIISQLRSLVPGIRVTPEDEYPHETWTRAAEIGLTAKHRPLKIVSATDMSASLLASMQALGPGEAVIVQWVVTPGIPVHPPIYGEARSAEVRLKHLSKGNLADRDEVEDTRKKREEQNFMAVLRVGAVAGTSVRADHMIYRVRAALASVRGPSTRFVKRFVTNKGLQKRIDEAAGSYSFPIQLSVSELTSLMGWPIGGPQIVGLPRPLGKQFAPHSTVPSEGIVVGHSSFPGAERPVAIGFDEARMHTHIIGETGTGKSVVLDHIATQVMAAGHGLILMEASGNLYEAVLDHVPRERVEDVILLDLSDKQYSVPFNVLDQGSPETVIDEIMDLFAYRYGTGIWSDEYILNGMRTLAENPSLTLMDLAPLLAPTTDELKWADNITRSVKDPELRRWWQRHEDRGIREQQKRADPVLSRISQMAARPELRYMLGQQKSAFQALDVFNQNKILLVNLKGVSKETASLAGTLIMNAIWHAAQNSNVRRPNSTYLVLDEFARFMDLPIDTESMLAEARKYKFGMFLAHQHMTQLKPSVQDGVISNARNKIVLTANNEDARMLSRELHGAVDAEDITSLQAYEAIASVMTPAGSSGPISIGTLAPKQGYRIANMVRSYARTKYAQPVKKIQDELEARYSPSKAPGSRKPSKLSGSDWGL